MSADNYLYVRKIDKAFATTAGGEWTVTTEFMSDEDGPRCVMDSDPRFVTWAEAYKAAQKMEQEEPYGCEYGIHSDPAE